MHFNNFINYLNAMPDQVQQTITQAFAKLPPSINDILPFQHAAFLKIVPDAKIFIDACLYSRNEFSTKGKSRILLDKMFSLACAELLAETGAIKEIILLRLGLTLPTWNTFEVAKFSQSLLFEYLKILLIPALVNHWHAENNYQQQDSVSFITTGFLDLIDNPIAISTLTNKMQDFKVLGRTSVSPFHESTYCRLIKETPELLLTERTSHTTTIIVNHFFSYHTAFNPEVITELSGFFAELMQIKEIDLFNSALQRFLLKLIVLADAELLTHNGEFKTEIKNILRIDAAFLDMVSAKNKIVAIYLRLLIATITSTWIKNNAAASLISVEMLLVRLDNALNTGLTFQLSEQTEFPHLRNLSVAYPTPQPIHHTVNIFKRQYFINTRIQQIRALTENPNLNQIRQDCLDCSMQYKQFTSVYSELPAKDFHALQNNINSLNSNLAHLEQVSLTDLKVNSLSEMQNMREAVIDSDIQNCSAEINRAIAEFNFLTTTINAKCATLVRLKDAEILADLISIIKDNPDHWQRSLHKTLGLMGTTVTLFKPDGKKFRFKLPNRASLMLNAFNDNLNLDEVLAKYGPPREAANENYFTRITRSNVTDDFYDIVEKLQKRGTEGFEFDVLSTELNNYRQKYHLHRTAPGR